MTLRVKVKFGELKRLEAALQRMPSVMDRIVVRSGNEVLELIENSFAAQRSPDGQAWAPRKGNGGHPILTRTGALRGGFKLIPYRRSFVIRNSVPYGVFHQNGTRKMVARPFFPRRGLPAPWRSRILRVVEDEMRGALR